jgi:hypothetical protein
MVLLAFSLQDQIEKYGAYVGIVAFFGLAILSLLYFAQAREVKRLRDWAGRAPERAAEVEAMAIEHAEELRRARQEPAPAPAQAPAAQPAPATAAAGAAGNGAVKLAPAEVAALAFARAAGVHTPHPPRPHPAHVPAAVPATEVAAAGAATATGNVAAVQDLAPASNGHGTGTVPPPVAPGEDAAPPAEPAVPAPATPAARREETPPPAAPRPAPAAPLRQTPPPRRPAPRRPVSARPARRESSTRAVVLTAVVGVLVLGAAAFAVTQLFGGGDNTPAKPPKVAQSTAAPTATGTATAQATPALTKATMRVAVYNGTIQSGLAGGVADQLVNLGYTRDNVGADTYTPNQQRQASVVMYERGDRPAAAQVARDLNISDVRLIDSATQQLIDQSGKKWDVIVIVGADKSQ